MKKVAKLPPPVQVCNHQFKVKDTWGFESAIGSSVVFIKFGPCIFFFAYLANPWHWFIEEKNYLSCVLPHLEMIGIVVLQHFPSIVCFGAVFTHHHFNFLLSQLLKISNNQNWLKIKFFYKVSLTMWYLKRNCVTAVIL